MREETKAIRANIRFERKWYKWKDSYNVVTGKQFIERTFKSATSGKHNPATEIEGQQLVRVARVREAVAGIKGRNFGYT